MPKIRIDNREVQVADGATILDAARALGIDIPTLCHKDGCEPQTSCLVCVVRVNGAARLVPSCATKAVEGMNVESETEPVRTARRTALELLLADHAGDCLAPCQNVCPAHMNIPEMIRLINAGRFRDSLIVVKQHIALPAILGRICPELCEKGCHRGEKDDPVSICNLKRFVADTDLASPQPYLPPCQPATGRKVAIVGTGPAGLAAAYYLQQLGHACTLFDDHPLPGGNLRYAVGEDKLPHSVLDAEINTIKLLGAQFQLGVKVGADLKLADLQAQYDAVLVAIGEPDEAKANALGIPLIGRGLKVDRNTRQSPIKGVFIAGAAGGPCRHAVRSSAEGRDAARHIDQYLGGRPVHGKDDRWTVRLGQLSEPELATFMAGSAPDGRSVPVAAGQGLSDAQAEVESSRCLNCDCGKLDGCRLRQVSIQYSASATRFRGERRPYERIATHPRIIYEPGKCISCGLCVEIASQYSEPLGLTFVGRGFTVRVSVPFSRDLAEGLQKAAEECAQACPTAALTLRSTDGRPAPTHRDLRLTTLSAKA